jgi:hypothetical protein
MGIGQILVFPQQDVVEASSSDHLVSSYQASRGGIASNEVDLARFVGQVVHPLSQIAVAAHNHILHLVGAAIAFHMHKDRISEGVVGSRYGG